jgi:hypothetical protein
MEKRNAYDAIKIIDRQLSTYGYHADADMARFIKNHYDTISMMIPGEGSGSHKSRMSELLNIYNKAVAINSMIPMNKYSYYRISNENAEGFVKTSNINCFIVSLTYEGKVDIKQYDTCFKRFNGDVVVEITLDQFKDGARKVADQLIKILGL